MDAVHSSVRYEAATPFAGRARETPVRAADAPQPVYRRRASDAERALHLNARIALPFVAQVLGQIPAREAADPRAAAAAYARAGEIRFEPTDLVAPV